MVNTTLNENGGGIVNSSNVVHKPRSKSLVLMNEPTNANTKVVNGPLTNSDNQQDNQQNDTDTIVQIDKIYLLSRQLAVDFMINGVVMTKGIPYKDIDLFEVYSTVHKVSIINQGRCGSLTVEFNEDYRFKEFFDEIVVEELGFEMIDRTQLETFVADEGDEFPSLDVIEHAFYLADRPMPKFMMPPGIDYYTAQSTIINRLKLHCSIMIEEFETFQHNIEQDLIDPDHRIVEEVLEESFILCIIEQDDSKQYPQYEIVEPLKLGAKPILFPLPKRQTKWKLFSKKAYKNMFLTMIEIYKQVIATTN